MPCGCFGNKKRRTEKGGSKEDLKQGVPVLGGRQPNEKVPFEDERVAKKKDVIASDVNDTCPLLGLHSTSSRPPSSSYVDSPTSNSHPHTPSTLPALGSSTSSPASSVASAPAGPEGAFCRAHLAEKRREFFSDLYPLGGRRRGAPTPGTFPSTLPTAARARQFGKVRPMRPSSQPSSPHEPPPLPGPHLLHPVPQQSRKEPAPDSGFASPEFLAELRSASDEIARRWALTEAEREAMPCPLRAKAQHVHRDAVDVVVTPPSPPHVENPTDELLFSSPVATSEENEAPLKELTSAIETKEDILDLSDEPAALHSDMVQGGGKAGITLTSLGEKESFSIQMNHKGNDFSAHSSLD